MIYPLVNKSFSKIPFEDIEESLNSMGVIKVKGYTHKDEPLENFISSTLLDIVGNANYESGAYHGSFRSLVDITRICKAYYPNATFKEVAKIVSNLPTKLNGGQWCNNINRYTFVLQKTLYNWTYWGKTTPNEFGYTLEEMRKF